jgi:putative ABC transport system permease protein
MALRNAARNPGRSTLTIGLVAAASFLIVAVSAFRLDPNQQTPSLHSGNGGFALAAESDQPIFHNLNTSEGRQALGFSSADDKLFDGTTFFSLRVRAGDDASCLNLYRPQQPRILGVPKRFIEHGGFAWADIPPHIVEPWQLLDTGLPLAWLGFAFYGDGANRPVPVVLEKNTANYSLNLWGGVGETFEITDEDGRPLKLQVAALLGDSIFQGDLLMSEYNLLRHFPNTNGYRFFLVETRPDQTTAVQQSLARNLGDYGLSVETTGQRLAEFLTVQNTYLSTFQSLGGLGLLLGTLGLAAVQLRAVLERRGELALLRAAGFRRRWLAFLVLLEHAALLIAGLAIGVIAALVAVLPQVLVRVTSLPWSSLAATLLAVLLLGLVSGLLAVRSALRAPLLAALREENA